jgi:hypothetical protein
MWRFANPKEAVQWLRSNSPGRPTGFYLWGEDGAVEIFHLRWPGINGLDYITLDEALEAQCIEVTEFTETGQVPRIKIINRSGHMVFVMAGEQLVGCKQNRVVNASIMIPPHSEMPLPVTCVERGRWGYRSAVFSSAHSSAVSVESGSLGRKLGAGRVGGNLCGDSRF